MDHPYFTVLIMMEYSIRQENVNDMSKIDLPDLSQHASLALYIFAISFVHGNDKSVCSVNKHLMFLNKVPLKGIQPHQLHKIQSLCNLQGFHILYISGVSNSKLKESHSFHSIFLKHVANSFLKVLFFFWLVLMLYVPVNNFSVMSRHIPVFLC